MEKSVSIIGGDIRLSYLAKLYSQENINVYTYGQEKCEILENKNIIKCNSIKDAIDNSNTVISSIPFSRDGFFVSTVYSNKKIEISEMAKHIKNKTFIAGKIPNKFYDISKNNNVKIIDLLKNESMSILNSIPTAEGAIKIAIEETKATIHGSNVLILGFGRIGKILAKYLQGFGANIYCEARKQEDLAWIESLGYRPIHLTDLSSSLQKESYDIIFNTIPKIILSEEKLKLINKDTLIIDLASSPGGVDNIIANKLKIKVISALALPGKIAPLASAKIIKQTIKDIIM